MKLPRKLSGSAPGDRLLLTVLIVLIVGTPTVFLRTAMLTFTIPQVTYLWVTSVVVLLIGVYRVAVSGEVDSGPKSYWMALSAFAAALALVTIVSPQPWVSFTGLPARGAGALTYLLCLVLLHVVYGLAQRRPSEPLVLAFVATHALVVLYALLQAYGLDPISWGIDTRFVGVLVFSTLGNGNFSSGYVGLTLPLLVWVAFGSSMPSLAKVVGGGAIGTSLIALTYLDSFQGQVAAMVACAVLAQWAMTRGRRDRLVAVLVVLPVAVAVVGLPLLLSAPGWSTLLVVVAVTAACAGFGVLKDQRGMNTSSDRSEEPAGGWFWPMAAAGLVAVGVLGALFRERIVAEVASGLEQRTEFWKASLSIFRESPLTGRGLETYSSYFTAHRSVEHAVQWESLLSDSPHSVPFGMLSGGGLILAGTYLAVLLVIGYFGILAVTRAEGPLQPFYGAVLASWVAYHVQAFVSIDVPGLIYTQWVLGGILIAGGASMSKTVLVLPWKPRSRRPRSGDGVQGARQLLTITVLAVAFLLVLGPLSAPLRANMAVSRAQAALGVSDPRTVEIELVKAIELQPRYGYYAESMAFLYEQGGFFEAAFTEMDRGARLQPGIPYIALKAARAGLAVGRMDAAAYWYERALEADPNGVTAITEAAEFYSSEGKSNLASTLMESFESLGSSNTAVWKTAERVYLALGDDAHAEKAAACYGAGGIPIPDDC